MKPAPIVPVSRHALLEALRTMPEEAFGWFVYAVPTSAMLDLRAHTQIWPDGLGGFMEASRRSIETLRVAARDYLDAIRAANPDA